VGAAVKRPRRMIPWGLLAVLLLAALACSGENAPAPTSRPTTRPAPTSTQAPVDWIWVYFTDPTAPNARDYEGGPDGPLAAAIDQARLSVDMAMYAFNIWSVRDALLDAHQRGVQVRVTTESENMDEDEIQELIDAGIQVIGDRREGLMHNKFLVIDRYEVWTGSTNLTVGGLYRNDNNLIRIRSTRLAENYTREFEEEFVDDNFGTNGSADTPYPVLTVEGTQLEVYFSPDDDPIERLLELVAGAKESIYFMAFSYTSDDLASVMLSRAQVGVTVAGVFEKAQYNTNTGTEFENLRSAGLAVRLDGNPNDMHHKVMIIDESIVITGSYNFTASAENRNDENVLVIFSPDVAAQYLEEFWRVYQMAPE